MKQNITRAVGARSPLASQFLRIRYICAVEDPDVRSSAAWIVLAIAPVMHSNSRSSFIKALASF